MLFPVLLSMTRSQFGIKTYGKAMKSWTTTVRSQLKLPSPDRMSMKLK